MSLKDYINNAINEHRRAIQSGLTYFGTQQQEDNKLWSLIDKVWNFAWDTEVRLAALEKAAKLVEEQPKHKLEALGVNYWRCRWCNASFEWAIEAASHPCPVRQHDLVWSALGRRCAKCGKGFRLGNADDYAEMHARCPGKPTEAEKHEFEIYKPLEFFASPYQRCKKCHATSPGGSCTPPKPKKKIVVSRFCYSDSSGKWYVLKEHKKFCDFSVVFHGYKSVEIEFEEGEFDE